MTAEQQKIMNSLTEYERFVMSFTTIRIKESGSLGFVPEKSQKKVEYLQKNGFLVKRADSDNTIIFECDISEATFEQKLEIWGYGKDE